MTFSVTVLGSGSALPTSSRISTAHVLNIHERYYLIDCAESTQIQMRRFKIQFRNLNHIFISHLHGDHYFGLFGLLSTFKLLGRKNTLHIYSPAGLQSLIESQFENYDEGIGFPIAFHVLNCQTKETILEEKNLSVSSFPLHHRIPTCGFLFRERPKPNNIIKEVIEQYQLSIKEIVAIKAGGIHVLSSGKIIPNEELCVPGPVPRSYAFCSDTMYCKDLIPILNKVDLLYHDSTFTNDMIDRAKETFHSTAEQAAQIAAKANAGQLVLGHFSARYKDLSIFLEEAKPFFENSVLAYDGLKIEIKSRRRVSER